MCRGGSWRQRAGPAFVFGGPGVADGAPTNAIAAGCHGPRQDDQTAKAKPLTRDWLRILDQGLGPTNPLSKQPAA